MNVSFERKMLNRNNIYVDDPMDKVYATSAQKKATDGRDKKKLRKFVNNDIQAQLADMTDEDRCPTCGTPLGEVPLKHCATHLAFDDTQPEFDHEFDDFVDHEAAKYLAGFD